VSGSRAGLAAAQPPQNRTCRFLRIRLKHRPAHARSTAGTVRDGTSGGRERGSYLRWRSGGAPRRCVTTLFEIRILGRAPAPLGYLGESGVLHKFIRVYVILSC
jgi:hypothetical protein